ncbi:hypothetical protein TNCT_89551 [Trichonephila clavata]|uniref:Uncharacterized protein n=1 Tax=Trichonephila clavata TaxID=2740835 RepID=A0A8X6KXZ0_TRICU|nr:hypothetical protein TNCT_89551 [Trichonephila clavata]
MVELDEMFDDLRFAKNGLRKWMMETTADFTEDEEEKPEYLQLKEDLEPNCIDDFVHKIKGMLEVTHDEFCRRCRVKGGLEDCKKICFEEPKCRAMDSLKICSLLKRLLTA